MDLPQTSGRRKGIVPQFPIPRLRPAVGIRNVAGCGIYLVINLKCKDASDEAALLVVVLEPVSKLRIKHHGRRANRIDSLVQSRNPKTFLAIVLRLIVGVVPAERLRGRLHSLILWP